MKITTYTFKEVFEKTGYKSSVIRYYEKEFNLNIPRDQGGRRIFTDKELNTFLYIKKFQDQGYNNKQIKKIMEDGGVSLEVAATSESSFVENNPVNNGQLSAEVIKYLDEKLSQINSSLTEINQNVGSKERDILLSENLKLKMELKKRAYEVIELKENIRYMKESKKGLFKKLFKK